MGWIGAQSVIVYRNIEFRRTALALISFNLCMFFGLMAVVNHWVDVTKNEIVRRDTAIIGAILEQQPSMIEHIAPLFTKDIPQKYISKGLQKAAEYGYTTDMATSAAPLARNLSIELTKQVNSCVILFGVVMTSFVLWQLRSLFRQVEKAALSSESMLKTGDFSPLAVTGDGSFAALNHSLNEVFFRLRESIVQLKGEKEFLKDVVADISHQLKTPLSSLIMFNELLIKPDLEDDHRSEFLWRSKQELERMEWLTLTLLKIAKMEVGAIEFNKRLMPLASTLTRAIDPFSLLVKEKELNLIVPKDCCIELKHDSNWLAEAFANILKNAIEHTPNGGTISLIVSETPVTICVSIKDDGEGIPREQLPYIFKSFYASKFNKSSVGIGLPLARSIIEKHGGVISVNSSPGDGTEFNVTFLKE